MAQPTDTSPIQRLIGRTGVRIRIQWALEGGTTAVILAAATALVAIFGMRARILAPQAGLLLLIVAGVIVIAGATFAAARRLDDETVARRIDRASNLADRLSTAIAFHRVFAGPKAEHDETTEDMMLAAIRDGVRAAPRANIRAAAPFTPPKDLRAALGFLAISALAAGLALPSSTVAAQVYRITPDHAQPGTEVIVEGQGFGTHEGSVLLATPDHDRPLAITQWAPNEIRIKVPADAKIGDQKLIVVVNEP